jgi:hypothetical protein
MGTGFRCFWVGDDGRMHPVGSQRFVEIFYDGTKVMPEFAGRMVALIEVVYETLNRRATQLLHARGYRFPFDPSGRLDVETQRRFYPWTALLDELADRYVRDPGNVRRIESRLAANRIRKEVFFNPTPDQIQAIRLVLGIVAPPRPPRPLQVVRATTTRSNPPTPRTPREAV